MNYNNKTAEQFFNELKLDDKVKVYHRIYGTDSYEWLDGVVIGFKIANQKCVVVETLDNKKIAIFKRNHTTHIQHRD